MEQAVGFRRRNAAQTRAKILDAAQQAFAEIGYAAAGIREIAALAAVDSALIGRYFGSKAGLFEAALLDAMRAAGLFEGGRAGIGQRLAKTLAAEDLDIRLPAMIVLCIGDAEARAITARMAKEHIIKPLAKWLGPPNARVRAMQLIMLCTGFVIYTRQIPVGFGRRKVDGYSRKWLAQAIQAIVDQSEVG